MRLSPDQLIFWQHGFIKLNGTIVFTWALMFVLGLFPQLLTGVANPAVLQMLKSF